MSKTFALQMLAAIASANAISELVSEGYHTPSLDAVANVVGHGVDISVAMTSTQANCLKTNGY